MKRFPSLMRHALALSLAIGTALPAAAAAPSFVANAPVASSNVVDVQYRRDNRRDQRWDRRADRRDQRRGDRFERRGNQAYWRGHRGYRQARPGYRQHNGWWFPPAAFIAGAIVGGGANAAPPARGLGSRHVAWCQERWRSYRASDNSYQPYNGPRRQCVSPYS